MKRRAFLKKTFGGFLAVILAPIAIAKSKTATFIVPKGQKAIINDFHIISSDTEPAEYFVSGFDKDYKTVTKKLLISDKPTETDMIRIVRICPANPNGPHGEIIAKSLKYELKAPSNQENIWGI